MREIDKAAMGRRVRQIRVREGMRQWELARVLGTTQSAVHKYEHGVVPEPRRLLELARIGRTTVEWILTGSHWDGGSDEQERLDPALLRTALLLGTIPPAERAAVDEALAIVRAADAAIGEAAAADDETVQILEAALRIRAAVVERVLRGMRERLTASPLASD